MQATRRFSESGVTLCGSGFSSLDGRIIRNTTYCISINHENILVEGRVDADDVAHLVVYFELQRRHGSIKVHAVEVVEEQDLGVTFATVTRLLTLAGLANLHDDHVSTRRVNSVVSLSSTTYIGRKNAAYGTTCPSNS